MTKFCDIADREVAALIAHIEKMDKNVDLRTFDHLKTLMYVRYHGCYSHAEKVASMLPPPPHKIPEAIGTFVEKIDKRVKAYP